MTRLVSTLYDWCLAKRYGLLTRRELEEFYADEQRTAFFFGPEGLDMLSLMLKREDGMRWAYDPIAPPVVKRVAP